MTPNILTFIIPVRHQANARDWQKLAFRLQQTAASIAAQTDGRWNAIVVANNGAEIPELPSKFSTIRVDYDPNLIYDLTPENRENVYDAFRKDKGYRVLSGLLAAPASEFIMIVDDDDFVSSKLVEYVSKNRESNGWTIGTGYVWAEGGKVLYQHNDFASLCGTSHIVRRELYPFSESVASANEDLVKSMLGSHIQIDKILRNQGRALDLLPFPGAVYRVGHPEAHSKSRGVFRTYVANRSAVRSPLRALRNLLKFKSVSSKIKREFGVPT